MALRNSASEPSPLPPFCKRVQIGPTLKVIHISLLYSPWGPFPDRFVQHVAFRASQLASQLAS